MMRFKMCRGSKAVLILDEYDKEIGKIFTPSGSGGTSINCIQVCGFSEAFDLWGCGIFKGFKDIQLLFDDKMLDGTDNFRYRDDNACMCCYREPCQCEVKIPLASAGNPFLLKREEVLKERIIKKGQVYKH